MRIQNNITAMNTHRMYTINNDAVAASAKKLSSGYRINSAADDAAGLAISEKMRSQIRGLNMATKNSQDAISLVQTAEGALQETQNMLQRMNELAVQAATGTNEDLDRTALAKEYEQLKREINDVAEQTNFNNMKILDGSLSYAGYVRSASTAGVNNTVTTDPGTANALSMLNNTQAIAGVTSTAAKDASGKVTLANGDVSALRKNDSFSVRIELADGRVLNSKTFTLATVADTTNGVPTAAEIATAIGAASGLTFEDGSDATNLTIKGNGSDIVFEAGSAVGDAKVDFTGAKVTVLKHAGDPSQDREVITSKENPVASAANKTLYNNPEVNQASAEVEYQIDLSKVKAGDTFSINGKTYEVTSDANATNGAALANGNVAVKWNGATDQTSDLVKNLADAIGTTAATGSTVQATAVSTSTIKITGTTVTQGDAASAAASNKSAELIMGAGGQDRNTTNTIEFDVAKMKDGDTFKISAGGQTLSVTYNDGDTRSSFMNKVKTALTTNNISGDWSVKGNALLINGAKVDSIKLESGKLPETNAVRIQVGALENEQLAVSIDSMNTAGLKLDDTALTVPGGSTSAQQDKAGEAITAVRDAINKVSDQRATLGAMQNRLEHKIANLKTTTENLSASESRIRDVDMASEMTEFTKNNILSQAATAMLAQANALPQNVLSLLG